MGKDDISPSKDHGKSHVDSSNPHTSEMSKSDLSNPYYTHHSDHPGLVLISKPLNGDNYAGWKRAMTLALNSKNKLGFVNGTITAPSEETDLEGYATWSRCNDMVHSWIINTLDPEISDSVIYYPTAQEVWEDLHERFSQVRKAYAAVAQDEKQRSLYASHLTTESSSAVMAVRNPGRSNYNSGRGGRFEKNDRQNQHLNRSFGSQEGRRVDTERRQGSGRGRPHYTYCGDQGHWVQTYYQLIGYPPCHPKAKQGTGFSKQSRAAMPSANQVSEAVEDGNGPTVTLTEAQFKQFMAALSNPTLKPDSNASSGSKANVVTKPGLSKVVSRDWIIDSGATNHITSSTRLLHKNNNCSLPPVLLPSGDEVDIVAKGSIPLSTMFYLHDVLSVPKFKVDLLSDLAMRRTIGLDEQCNGLYYLMALATEKSKTRHLPFPSHAQLVILPSPPSIYGTIA
ncbi:uncharacterized protein LOC133730695 [Rosa rugosa]|uniref:uncharacterized protein LOC133730695 n=1 Tax=Rosa rugosa TaxID=74645 RepID=UPI002B415FD2|nr:uncharacterized protein LOC133730695 [Rosa rugosa]